MPARPAWKILSHTSPSCQREWMDKWPTPFPQATLESLEHLRMNSIPLAHFATVYPIHPSPSSQRWELSSELKGIWLDSGVENGQRKLICRSLPAIDSLGTLQGYMILLSEEKWIPTLKAYFSSPIVSQWLESCAERKGDHWVFHEQIMKWIPIPKSLMMELQIPHPHLSPSKNPFHLPKNWENLEFQLFYHPQKLKTSLENQNLEVRVYAYLFRATAQALDTLMQRQTRLFSLVDSDGKIDWKEALCILPEKACIPFTLHPQIYLAGHLPPHLPITQIRRVESPHAQILFSTETGFHLQITTELPILLQMIWNYLKDLKNPTWHELTQLIQLPKNLPLAETTAFELLRKHEEQAYHLQILKEILNHCQLF